MVVAPAFGVAKIIVTWLVMVENIGPSSEANSLSPRSCSRRLIVVSGIRFAAQIVDIRAIGLKPGSVSPAQLALIKRTALVIGVAGNHRGANTATPDCT